MNKRGPGLSRRALQALASPTLLVAVAAIILFATTIGDLADLLCRSQRVHAEMDLARAQLAAETALARHAGEIADEPCHVEVAGLQLAIDRDVHGFVVTCCDGDRRSHVFYSADLPGGGPAALAHHRAATDPEVLRSLGGGLLASGGQLPTLEPGAVAAAPRANPLFGFRRDHSIALEHLAVGTDREDFVWAHAEPSRGGLHEGLLVVPGHLWLEPGNCAFELELAADVVLLVQGNVYLGRSLHVVGPGRLLLATTVPDGAVLFADRDGSGGWSSGDQMRRGDGFTGPVEGAGSIYLGMPGRSDEIVCDAALVVAGELHLSGPSEVRGPMVLHHGFTELQAGAGAALAATGGWTYRPGRERIPGMRVTGPPRAGLLRPASAR